ncbi:MAG: hypothetical protein M0P69_15885 [Bacteroidales bacterium]|jgi:hypothetical protein|nr:hypothetical protein [Bacteroidales bacterium]
MGIEEYLVNLTPHPVVLEIEGRRYVIDSEQGQAVRVSYDLEEVFKIGDKVPVYREVPGSAIVKGLPDPQPGKYFITSAMVARAAHRPDVFSPNTHPKYVKRAGRAGPIETVSGLITYV